MDNFWRKQPRWLRAMHINFSPSHQEYPTGTLLETASNDHSLQILPTEGKDENGNSTDKAVIPVQTSVHYERQPFVVNRYTTGKADNEKVLIETATKLSLNIENYAFLLLIGKGNFSQVYIAQAPNGTLCAVKMILNDRMTPEHAKRIVENEKLIMQICENCPFILSLRHYFQTQNAYFLVSEFCSGGDLYYHYDNTGPLSEDEVRFVASEVASGLNCLHLNGIAYRDCKSENILINSLGHVVLADLGLAITGVCENHGATSICGTLAYLPPEILSFDHSLEYGYLVDFWGFGTVIYDLLIGSLPFFHTNVKTMCSAILTKDIYFPKEPNLSLEVKDLISKLLIRQPEQRLGSSRTGGFNMICKHAFFANVNWDGLEAASKYAAPIKLTNHKNTLLTEIELPRKLTDSTISGKSFITIGNFQFDSINTSIDAGLRRAGLVFPTPNGCNLELVIDSNDKKSNFNHTMGAIAEL